MARFSGGWVKVYRSAWENDLGDNPYLFALWSTLLIMATWRPAKIRWMGKQREIQPGSVVLGIKELSDKWDCSRSVLQKHLRYLHDTGRIVLEACSRGTLITICNWEEYQSTEDAACEPSVNGVLAASSPSVNGEALIEEVKKRRKKKEEGRTDSGLPEIAQIWNQEADKKLARVVRMNPVGIRSRACKARWEENPDPEYWKNIVHKINASEFCLGKNDRGWLADIEFLCRPDTGEKFLEGKYKNSNGHDSHPVIGQAEKDYAREMDELVARARNRL